MAFLYRWRLHDPPVPSPFLSRVLELNGFEHLPAWLEGAPLVTDGLDEAWVWDAGRFHRERLVWIELVRAIGHDPERYYTLCFTPAGRLVCHGEWGFTGYILGAVPVARILYLSGTQIPALILEGGEDITRPTRRNSVARVIKVVGVDPQTPNYCYLKVTYRWVTNGELWINNELVRTRLRKLVRLVRSDATSRRRPFVTTLLSVKTGQRAGTTGGAMAYFDADWNFTPAEMALVINTFDPEDGSVRKVTFKWDHQQLAFRGPPGGPDQWFQVDQEQSRAFAPTTAPSASCSRPAWQ